MKPSVVFNIKLCSTQFTIPCVFLCHCSMRIILFYSQNLNIFNLCYTINFEPIIIIIIIQINQIKLNFTLCKHIEITTYTNWLESYPGSLSNEQCISVNNQDEAKWKISSCDEKNYVICEYGFLSFIAIGIT